MAAPLAGVHSIFHPERAGRFAPILAAVLGMYVLTGCTTIPRSEFAEKSPLRAKYSPRWDTNEVDYDWKSEENPSKGLNPIEKGGRNFRDGFIGVINNFVQATFAVFTISPTSGYVVEKTAIMTGDVIGLIDDNEITEHVFLGILSRQFLRFGTGVQDFSGTMGAIHDTNFDAPVLSTVDIVGPKMFHTKAYGKPSAIFTAVGVLGGDLIVRPAGNFVLMFGGRKTQEKIDKFGLDLIQYSMEVPFL